MAIVWNALYAFSGFNSQSLDVIREIENAGNSSTSTCLLLEIVHALKGKTAT